MQKIEYRELRRSEIEQMREIDRSEVIDSIYLYKEGALVEKEAHFDMKGFPGNELEGLIERQKLLFDEGGKLYGAFDSSHLVGIASVEKRIRGKKHRYCKMDILHVSKAYRSLGIATRLMQAISAAANALGAERLYISATESKNTIRFYMGRGARLVEELDEELFALEPNDIHLELMI